MAKFSPAHWLEYLLMSQRAVPAKKVAIIVLNWNGLKDTLACLASLKRLDYSAYEVVVIDNGSTDNSVEMIRVTHPWVTLIETGENLGYVGGNNRGLEYARQTGADYGLLLNNDTEVSPNFLNLLVEAAEQDPTVGIVGPTIYYFDEPEVIWSAGGAIDWQQGDTAMIGLNQVDRGQFGQLPRPVQFVTGCALLIKMRIVGQVGLLDDRFFAYYEETEWCVRVSRAGFQILHVPQAKIWHKISLVAREASPQVHYYMIRNRLLFLKLSQAGLVSRVSILFHYGRILLSWSLKPKWRHKAPQRQAMVRAILDYGRGRFGKVNLG
jgi:GT2 family glycosyltransferase